MSKQKTAPAPKKTAPALATAKTAREIRAALEATPTADDSAAFLASATAARKARKATPAPEATAPTIVAPTAVSSGSEDSPARRVARAPLALDSKIVWLVAANPKTPGSKSFDRFARYFGTTTVAAYLAAGGLRADITWEAAREFLRVDPA